MFITALVIGFLGSLHCAGMCSPLAMAVTSLSRPALINRVTYNGGRIISYGIQGVVAASVGTLFEFTGLQHVLSISLGLLLIVAGFAGITRVHIPVVSSAIQTLTTFIKIRLGNLIQRKTRLSLLITGALNGLLPCGLTYMALTYCLTITNPAEGFAYMLVFGLGTLPVMLGVTTVLQTLMLKFNFSFKRLTTVSMIMLGVLLISRSLPAHHASEEHTGKDGITLCRSIN